MLNKARHSKGRRATGGWLAILAAGAFLWALDARIAYPSSAGIASAQGPALPAATSVLDGVFTEDQATQGEQEFAMTCAACHTLAEHTKRRFVGAWANRTLADWYEQVSSTMPEGAPSSLQPDAYVSVLAYFLRETGYPTGQQFLSAERQALEKIRIVPPPE